MILRLFSYVKYDNIYNFLICYYANEFYFRYHVTFDIIQKINIIDII